MTGAATTPGVAALDWSIPLLCIWSVMLFGLFLGLRPRMPELDTYPYPESDKEQERLSYKERVKHYLAFLNMCCNLFCVLSVVSLIWVVPCWGFEYYMIVLPRQSTHNGGVFKVALTSDIDQSKLRTLCAMTLCYSVIAFYFVARFQQDTMRRISTHPKEMKALWLSNIPVRDHATQQRHELCHFTNVEADLKEALVDKLSRRSTGGAGDTRSTPLCPWSSCPCKLFCCHCNLACTLVCRCCTCLPHASRGEHPRAGSASKGDQLLGADFATRSRLASLDGLQDMDIRVSPVMDPYTEYVNLYYQIGRARERRRTFRRKVKEYEGKRGCWRRLLLMWYKSKYRKAKRWEEQSEEAFWAKEPEERPMQMSGDAFIVFEDEAHKSEMLEPRRKWFEIRDHTPFRFGRPPFSSVTLQCRHAPNPTDLVWENLHVPVCPTCLCYSFNLLCLVAVTVISVFGIAVASQLSSLSYCSDKGGVLMAKMPKSCTVAKTVAESSLSGQLPSLLLLFNSLVLPWWIEMIACQMRLRQRSMIELTQLYLNLCVLLLSKFVVPLVSLVLVELVTEYLSRGPEQNPQSRGARMNFWGVLLHILGAPNDAIGDAGMFYLKYTLNCAFLSNIIASLQFGRHFCRCFLLTLCAVTDSDRDYAKAVSTFAWGYWYAWSIGIAATGLIIGVVIPSMLPVTALSFWLKLKVDRNLFYEVRAFDPGPDSKGIYPPRCAHYMFCIIAAKLVFVSFLVVLFVEGQAGSDVHLTDDEKTHSYAWSIIMTALGFSLWILSRVSKLQLMLEEAFAPKVITCIYMVGVRLAECVDHLLMRAPRRQIGELSRAFGFARSTSVFEEFNLLWDARVTLLEQTPSFAGDGRRAAREAQERADEIRRKAKQAEAQADELSEQAMKAAEAETLTRANAAAASESATEKEPAGDAALSVHDFLSYVEAAEKLEAAAAEARARADRKVAEAEAAQAEADEEKNEADEEFQRLLDLRTHLKDLLSVDEVGRTSRYVPRQSDDDGSDALTPGDTVSGGFSPKMSLPLLRDVAPLDLAASTLATAAAAEPADSAAGLGLGAATVPRGGDLGADWAAGPGPPPHRAYLVRAHSGSAAAHGGGLGDGVDGGDARLIRASSWAKSVSTTVATPPGPLSPTHGARLVVRAPSPLVPRRRGGQAAGQASAAAAAAAAAASATSPPPPMTAAAAGGSSYYSAVAGAPGATRPL